MGNKAGAEIRALLHGQKGPRFGGFALALFAAILVIKIRIVVFVLRALANFLAKSLTSVTKRK